MLPVTEIALVAGEDPVRAAARRGRAADRPGPCAAAAGLHGRRAGHRPLAGPAAGPPPGAGPHRAWKWCWARSRRSCRAGRPAAGAAAVPRLRRAGPAGHRRARSTSGTSPALLGDVTEPTAPFGLLDVRGDGRAAEARRLGRRRPGRAGCASGPARSGVSPATLFHLAWARVLAPPWPAVTTWCSAPCCSAGCTAGAGADRVPGPFINTLPVRVRTVRRRRRRRGDRDAGAARRAAGPRARPAGAGPAGQRRRRAPAPLFTSLLNYRHSRAATAGAGAGLAGIELLLGPGAAPTTRSPCRSTTPGPASSVTVDAVAPGEPAAGLRAAAHRPAEPGHRAGAGPGHAAARGSVLAERSGGRSWPAWNDTAARGAGGDAAASCSRRGPRAGPGRGGGGLRGRAA